MMRTDTNRKERSQSLDHVQTNHFEEERVLMNAVPIDQSLKSCKLQDLVGRLYLLLSNHQASLAKMPLGHLLTPHFRSSSKHNNPSPKAIGKNQCSTGIVVEAITS